MTCKVWRAAARGRWGGARERSRIPLQISLSLSLHLYHNLVQILSKHVAKRMSGSRLPPSTISERQPLCLVRSHPLWRLFPSNLHLAPLKHRRMLDILDLLAPPRRRTSPSDRARASRPPFRVAATMTDTVSSRASVAGRLCRGAMSSPGNCRPQYADERGRRESQSWVPRAVRESTRKIKRAE